MKTLVIASVVALSAVFAFAQDKKPEGKPGLTQNPPVAAAAESKDKAAAAMQQQRAMYPLDKCPISGEKLDKDAVNTMVDGRLVRTCCDKCVAKIDGKKAEIFKQIDEGVIAAQKASYPLEKCPISGEELGKDATMKPVDFVYNTRLVRFCCPKCIDGFKKDPAATMQKLDRAYIASQKAKYTATVCPVSGDKLGDTAVDVLYGNKLVRMCCPDCKGELAKDPERVMQKLAELQTAAPGKTEKKGG
jgi:type II secretory ATPase GspE/PulE/Tfp pilus assembly ATPase PilB-like protein